MAALAARRELAQTAGPFTAPQLFQQTMERYPHPEMELPVVSGNAAAGREVLPGAAGSGV